MTKLENIQPLAFNFFQIQVSIDMRWGEVGWVVTMAREKKLYDTSDRV